MEGEGEFPRLKRRWPRRRHAVAADARIDRCYPDDWCTRHCAEFSGVEYRNDDHGLKIKRADDLPKQCAEPITLDLANPISVPLQSPSDASEFQISDIHEDVLGDNPEHDQPVGVPLMRRDPRQEEPEDPLQMAGVACATLRFHSMARG